MMKVLFVAHMPDGGGASVALCNLARGLLERGVEVVVATPARQGVLCEMLKKNGCRFYNTRITPTVYPPLGNPIKWLKRMVWYWIGWKLARRDLEKIISIEKPDIVHTNVGPLTTAYEICKKRKIPHVWQQREYLGIIGMKVFPALSSFRRKIHSQGNYNIAITKGVYDYYNLRPGLDRVLYDGVFSEKDVEGIKKEEKENYFVSVGIVNANKGIWESINAFSLFDKIQPGYKLKIVGAFFDDSYKRKCDDLVRAENLDEKVEFLGRRNDVYELLRKATAAIVGSFSEGFGFVAVESMLNYCPVIGRNVSGTKEQFDVGMAAVGEDIGYRFDSISELVDRMIECSKCLNQDRMLNNARSVVLRNYSIERQVEETEKYYKFILQDFSKKGMR